MASTLQADTIVNAAGTGAPNFSQGLKLSGGTNSLNKYVAWTDFSPTIASTGGGGTASVNTNLQSKYSIVGQILYISMRLTLTVSGTVNGIRLTLPASQSNVESSGYAGWISSDGAGNVLWARTSGATTIDFANISGANWPTGTPSANQFYFTGAVPVQ